MVVFSIMKECLVIKITNRCGKGSLMGYSYCSGCIREAALGLSLRVLLVGDYDVKNCRVNELQILDVRMSLLEFSLSLPVQSVV